MTSTSEGSFAPLVPTEEQQGIDIYLPPIPEHRLPDYVTDEELIPLIERTAGYAQMDGTYQGILERFGPGATGATPVVVSGALESSIRILDTLAPLTSGESWSDTVKEIAETASAQGHHFDTEHEL